MNIGSNMFMKGISAILGCVFLFLNTMYNQCNTPILLVVHSYIIQIFLGSFFYCSEIDCSLNDQNFGVILFKISPKVTSAANKVVITVLCFDKLQPIPKHKLLGKMEFHLHKLAKVPFIL